VKDVTTMITEYFSHPGKMGQRERVIVVELNSLAVTSWAFHLGIIVVRFGLKTQAALQSQLVTTLLFTG